MGRSWKVYVLFCQLVMWFLLIHIVYGLYTYSLINNYMQITHTVPCTLSIPYEGNTMCDKEYGGF